TSRTFFSPEPRRCVQTLFPFGSTIHVTAPGSSVDTGAADAGLDRSIAPAPTAADPSNTCRLSGCIML
ncbi:hypothetical protein NYY70_20105, partial [Acinetobacter baumannii]|nr:hypothetical protein [Acinetobacter baumannii]